MYVDVIFAIERNKAKVEFIENLQYVFGVLNIGQNYSVNELQILNENVSPLLRTSWHPIGEIKVLGIFWYTPPYEAGTKLCCSSRCSRCSHVSANTIIEEPRNCTCKSSNAVHYISCGPYLDLATGKPGVCWEKTRVNTLQPSQGRLVRFPRCKTFNTSGHKIDEKDVCCIKQRASNNARRPLSIFHLGTCKVTQGKRRFHFEITCSARSLIQIRLSCACSLFVYLDDVAAYQN